MWILWAFGSALFAGLTSVLAKCGIRKTDSTVATAIRTIVVLDFSWLMVFVVGSQSTIAEISGKTLLFLILSGVATGASWLCYFKALQLGDVNKVVPIDKSSTVLTNSAGGHSFAGKREPDQGRRCCADCCRHLSDDREEKEQRQNKRYGMALVCIGFCNICQPDHNFGQGGYLRRGVESGHRYPHSCSAFHGVGDGVFNRKAGGTKSHSTKGTGFICLSGACHRGSWLCYYKALQNGPASVVVPIDKLSILVTVLFSYIMLHEKLTKKSALGLVGIVSGTLLMLV